MNFWNVEDEINFFKEKLNDSSAPEDLFYKLGSEYLAYIPEKQSSNNHTIQSRNGLIGKYTENWCRNFLQPIAETLELFAVEGVVCPVLGLSSSSNGDIAFCTTKDKKQKPESIKLLFEVKMSIVNNYRYTPGDNSVSLLGNYTTHKGTPSLLRSDSMLKAIGKSINFRVESSKSNGIPIVVIGNTPITEYYGSKVDHLKQTGVVQGFISLYPEVEVSGQHVTETPGKGFQTFSDYGLLTQFITDLVRSDMVYFSSALSKQHLGRIIAVSSEESSEQQRASKFLQLLYEASNEKARY